MAPAFALPPPAPAPGEAWITVFDVGQGLAVLARTANGSLLYDTGPTFGPETDSGSRVVLPALRGAGLARLDLLVLTHEDADHVGGAVSVLDALEVGAIVSSLPPQHLLNALAPARRRCRSGDAWQWDGVRFEFLHPGAAAREARRNNQSCVLRIETAGGAMLLTGDIERMTEAKLLDEGKLDRTDVLVVPHHGSRSSSSPELIAALKPRYAIVPVGYRSRFGHPAPEVLERYGAAGAQILRTDLDGATLVRLGNSTLSVEAERRRRGRYWLQ